MGGGVLYQHVLLPTSFASHRHSLYHQGNLALRKVFKSSIVFSPALSRSRRVACAGWRWGDDDDDEDVAVDDDDANRNSGEAFSFQVGVALFNRGEYYQCHDVMESIWMKSQEPPRSVLHAILQCSVGLYHLFNQNHRGAMAEIGEGLAKLRRQRFTMGPFSDFEQEVSALLEYIYNTQLEYAACTEELCVTMDGSKESYQLLGNFAAGQPLYHLHKADNGESYICFLAPYAAELPSPNSTMAYSKVKVPLLNTTVDDFHAL